MAKRSYQQNCALARAADVIGERWTLLLIRDLLVSPMRFNELQQSMRGMGSNLLAARLKGLESAGLLRKVSQADGSHQYALTSRGRALEPTILALIRWGLTHGPEKDDDSFHQDHWDLLALKALYQPQRAEDLRVSVQFQTEQFSGWVTCHGARMQIGRGEIANPDLLIESSVAELFLGRPDQTTGLLAVGEAATLRKFMSAFALRT